VNPAFALRPETVRRAVADPRRARIERVVIDGETWTPIVLADGTYADRELAAKWADTPDPRRDGHPPRRVRFVAMDESLLVGDNAGQRVDVERIGLGTSEQWRQRGGLPLTLNHKLIVGVCYTAVVEPPGAVPGTEGHALVATASLLDTALTALVWDALQRGVLDSVCLATVTGDAAEGDADHVNLCEPTAACCRNARVLKTWEGDE
jgi:hypothetical protein